MLNLTCATSKNKHKSKSKITATEAINDCTVSFTYIALFKFSIWCGCHQKPTTATNERQDKTFPDNLNGNKTDSNLIVFHFFKLLQKNRS